MTYTCTAAATAAAVRLGCATFARRNGWRAFKQAVEKGEEGEPTVGSSRIQKAMYKI